MKLRDAGTLVFIIFVSLCAIGGAVSKYWLDDENVIEELAEEILEQELGVSIDLSPSSKEVAR